jgi:hypothetical protein
MPKVIYDKIAGLYQIEGTGIEVREGGASIVGTLDLDTKSDSSNAISGSILTLRGNDEPVFFHLGGNQHMSSNAWYDIDSATWKYATTGRAYKLGIKADTSLEIESAVIGTRGDTVSFNTAICIQAADNYVAIGKPTANCQLDITGSSGLVGLAVTGSVDIGGGADDAFFILPRLTDTLRNNLNAINGMMIYNTTTNKLNFYNGSAWRAVDDSAV